MPLTLSLCGSDSQNTGHLIIDRNNMIITYYADRSEESQDQADANRHRMIKLIFHKYYRKFDYLLSDEDSFAMTEDPRHDALEHMCKYDRRKCFHAHLIFKEDIKFNDIDVVFSDLKIDKYTDLISRECLSSILKISCAYFSVLEHSTAAQRIEAEYRMDKQLEFEVATKTVNAERNKKQGAAKLGDIFPLFAKNKSQQQSLDTSVAAPSSISIGKMEMDSPEPDNVMRIDF